MKISTWNVNSINARIDHLLKFIKTDQSDIYLLQELKTIEEGFPKKELNKIGYFSYVNGQKAWNGVAILSKNPIEITNTKIPNYEDENARFIETEIKLSKIKKKIKLINIYLPNGNPIETDKFKYKINWMKKFNEYVNDLRKLMIPIIIGGDFNVIPTDEDVYSPENYKNDACAHPLTREQYRILINKGLTDLVKYFIEGNTNWTFWGYRGGSWQKGNGLRIDHFLTTPNVTNLVNKVKINREPRSWEKASDHTPVTVEFIN
ncbi:MAG: Exodeoxyribonuclease III [Alphaproteobacteria bacterium MarineAlpha5_Bin5]|mgnify:CR=1 FL=1|nr:MAG: Exodeoxyribonuclease III [Alphaproteobacteria bacterium MarineAlpha5_Bin5]PPR52090.1 MAG: Exodeoxyribonuclease III [Alphaproteobacteria bacterium MarineAlpha5_Bin4]|tara:strand:- start:4654 stop:5439 length:786 start_codon:yes stop_codon:yes gene_type:complete